jgi:hypothetical protein
MAGRQAQKCCDGEVIITTEDAWRAAIESILQRLEWLAPTSVADLRALLTSPPTRPLL